MKSFRFSSALALACALLSDPSRADDWYFNTAATFTQGVYTNSQLRETLTDIGAVVSAEYLDRGGLTLGLNQIFIGMTGVETTSQQTQMLSGRLPFWLDSLPGKWSARLDLHHLDNNDPTGATAGVYAMAPQLSWLAEDASVYADLGYAQSRYTNGLSPIQLTPTVGFAFNDMSEWLQIRGYQVLGLDATLASNRTATTAVDVKWTHYLRPASPFVPRSMALNVSVGERIFAVDMDAQSVANLTDVNTGAVSLWSNWKLTDSSDLLVVLGQSRFENVTSNYNYQLNVAYASISTKW